MVVECKRGDRMKVEVIFEFMLGRVEVGIDLYSNYHVYGEYDLDDEDDCVRFLQLYSKNEVVDFYASDGKIKMTIKK